jgi:nucleoside-diphosphate-sugar epimerase
MIMGWVSRVVSFPIDSALGKGVDVQIVVIGGTGHIGSYLVPRLVRAGHDVTVLSRGERDPYHADAAWDRVRRLPVDRTTEDAAGTFGKRIADLAADVVIDLVCFTPDSARQLAEALRGHTGQLVHCGTVWVHGPSAEVPYDEWAPRRPFGEYGVQKAEIERYLLAESARGGVPTTILHPGHISGPGWVPINPAGNLELDAFSKLARGDNLALPNFGLETVHHVHADDVAQAFEQSLVRRGVAVGESFHVVSPRAISLRGYAEAVASWFGQQANLTFQPFDQWKSGRPEATVRATYDHIAHSPSVSIAKAEQLLDYHPRYTSLQAIREALCWLVATGQVDTGGRELTAA